MSDDPDTGSIDVNGNYPFPPGVTYDPGWQTVDPYIAPASYAVTDPVANKAFRGMLQQQKHDSRLTAMTPLQKTLQRGFMCMDPAGGNSKGYDGKGLRRFQFLFNPSTLPVTYGTNAQITPPDPADPSSATDGSALTSPNAGSTTSVTITLLMDRTYETWGNKQSRGVMEDIHQLELMTGWTEKSPYMLTAARVHLFLGPYQHFYGSLTSIEVEYTNWTQYMVPNRCSISIGMQIYSWSGDYHDGAPPKAFTVSTGNTDAAKSSQTYRSQVPPGNSTGQVTPNGWPASADRYKINVNPYKIPGTDVTMHLADAAAPLLVWAAGQFNDHVEHLFPGDCGGYNYRPNRNNPSVLSNHSSGTAIDLNSTSHPNGSDPSSNFSPSNIAYIRDNIIAPANGCLRWGGDYHGTKDGMHIEINQPPSIVAAQIIAMALVQP